METNETTATPPPDAGAFDVSFRGLAVEVTLHPIAPAGAPPTIEAILAALERTPLERVSPAPITHALESLAAATDEIHLSVGTVTVPRGSLDPCVVMVSPDGLAAYAVPTAPPGPPRQRPTPMRPADVATHDTEQPPARDMPPTGTPEAADEDDRPGENGDDGEGAAGNDVSTAMLRRLIAAQHIIVGTDEGVIEAFGEGEPLHDVVCIARGQEPVPGQDAVLAYHFDPNPRLIPLQRDDGSIDYHTLLVDRFVETETVLVTRTPPVLGTPGRTVSGARIEIPAVHDVALHEIAGKNTMIEGETLIAEIGGRPVQPPGGKIEVLPVFEVTGDQNYGVGNIDFPGDVVVRGDVRPGFSIHAGGAVVIRGVVEGATISAEHDLAVLGVVGEQPTRFDVGGDLAAGYLHTTIAEVAGTATIRREIVNCTLTAQHVVTSSSGRIVGGVVTAEDGIDAGVLGAPNGLLTEISVTSKASTAVIRARRTAHAGAVVHVGGVRRQLEDTLEAASFWEVAGMVVSLPAGADEDDVRKFRESPPSAA